MISSRPFITMGINFYTQVISIREKLRNEFVLIHKHFAIRAWLQKIILEWLLFHPS